MSTFRPGFVLEQTLGHVTHGQNLRRFIGREAGVEPSWYDVPFQPEGTLYRVPPLSTNWSLRGSLYARRALQADGWRELDALFVHTLTIALFATPFYDRIPTVLSLDATPINFDSVGRLYGHEAHPGAVERVKRNVVRRAVSRADAFVSWSEWAKRSLVDDYGADPDRVLVAAPGADLDLFPAGIRREGDGPVRILFVGGDFVRKGGDTLLQAYRDRLQGRAELHFVTAHQMPNEEGVFIHNGVKPNSLELLELFNTADIFALPTRGDCLAVVLGEAMAASLPIITTAVGAHAEAVEQDRSGLLVPPDNLEALGDTLETLVNDRALRQAMGARGREIAEERFDAKRNALAVLDLMRDVAGRSR
ncbi:MAG: glycosyltransferase family 4 protein [Dehalococcoidia bacterium]